MVFAGFAKTIAPNTYFREDRQNSIRWFDNLKNYFHVTALENLKSIKKHGLIPQPNRHTVNGDKQVWLVKDADLIQRTILLRNFKPLSTKRFLVVLSVNLSGVQVHRFGSTKEFYVTERIAPERISITYKT